MGNLNANAENNIREKYLTNYPSLLNQQQGALNIWCILSCLHKHVKMWQKISGQ